MADKEIVTDGVNKEVPDEGTGKEMITREEAKNFLRVDIDDDDALIDMYIVAAEEYVKSACGENVNLQCQRARIIMLMLVGDYYESRSIYGSGKYSQNIASMLWQLRLETEEENK